MRRLDALNKIIGTAGYAPLASLTTDHPFKDAALSLYDMQLRAQLSRGWYFNRVNNHVLTPTADGKVYLTHDIISFQPDLPGTYIQAGNRLVYLGSPFRTHTSAVSGRAIFSVPESDLPELFWQYVVALARVQFQSTYDGDSTKTRQLTLELKSAEELWGTEEIRGTRANILLSNPGIANLKADVHSLRRGVR